MSFDDVDVDYWKKALFMVNIFLLCLADVSMGINCEDLG